MKSIFGYKWFKFLIVLIGVCFVFYPWPLYKILFIILLIVPLLSILVFGFQRSSFITWYRLDYHGNDKYAYELSGVLNICVFFLAYRVLIDFYFEDRMLIWYAAIVIFLMIILFIFLPTTGKSSRPRKMRWPKFWLSLMRVMNISLYLIVAAYGINCIFDDSAPILYHVKIINKTIHRHKGNKTYKLKLEPWGNIKTPRDIKINKDLYNRLAIGDMIQINQKNGLLNLPWYYMDETNIAKWVAN